MKLISGKKREALSKLKLPAVGCWEFDKTLLFMGGTIEIFPLCVKEKVTTTYVALRWIGWSSEVLQEYRSD